MKKAILTLGLFSMIMVLTSFTVSQNTQSESETVYTYRSVDGGGGVKLPGDGGKKSDATNGGGGVKLPGDGGKKSDISQGDPQGGVKLPGDGGKKPD